MVLLLRSQWVYKQSIDLGKTNLTDAEVQLPGITVAVVVVCLLRACAGDTKIQWYGSACADLKFPGRCWSQVSLVLSRIHADFPAKSYNLTGKYDVLQRLSI